MNGSDDFRDGDPNFQNHQFAIAWHAQSCCSRLEGITKGDMKPAQAVKRLATIQLGHFEVCHGGVFACSKCAMDAASRSKSGREPLRGEIRGMWGQTRAQ